MNIQMIEPQAGSSGAGVRVQSKGKATADRIVPPTDPQGNRFMLEVTQ